MSSRSHRGTSRKDKRAMQKKVEKEVNKRLESERKRQHAESLSAFNQAGNPQSEDYDIDPNYTKRVDELTNRYNQELTQNRQSGRDYANQFMNREFQGIAPQTRNALQESANMELNRDLQNANRTILGKQGRAGVRGGAVYAQQRDLARASQDAQGQFQRDLTDLDQEAKRRNQSLAFNIEQGDAAFRNLNRQRADDLIQGNALEKRQRRLAKEANLLFSRI